MSTAGFLLSSEFAAELFGIEKVDRAQRRKSGKRGPKENVKRLQERSLK